jgi:hypothetical protein
MAATQPATQQNCIIVHHSPPLIHSLLLPTTHADGDLQHWVMTQHAVLGLCGVVALANHIQHEIHVSKVPIIAEMHACLDGSGNDSFRLRPIISKAPTTWKPVPRSKDQRSNVDYLGEVYKRAQLGAGIKKYGWTRMFRAGAAARAGSKG